VFTVICYDVADDRRRTRVMKYLKGSGTHVQESVFECFLDEAGLAAVLRALGGMIEPGADSVRCYRLDAAAIGRIRLLGLGTVSRDWTYYLVGRDGSG
jgi:CRISPR-associated protein Cas2